MKYINVLIIVMMCGLNISAQDLPDIINKALRENKKMTPRDAFAVVFNQYKKNIFEYAPTDPYLKETFNSYEVYAPNAKAFIKDENNNTYKNEITDSSIYGKFISDNTKALLIGEYHEPGAEEVAFEVINEIEQKYKSIVFASEFIRTGQEDVFKDYKKYVRLLEKEKVGSVSNVIFISDRLTPHTWKLSKESEIVALEDCRAASCMFVDNEQNKEINVTPEAIAYRNNFFMRQLQPYLKDKRLIVIYAGMAHVFHTERSGSLAQRLKDKNVEHSILCLYSKKRIYDKEELDSVEKGTFLFTVPQEKKESLGCDFIILYDSKNIL
jgi:hypothetical protein